MHAHVHSSNHDSSQYFVSLHAAHHVPACFMAAIAHLSLPLGLVHKSFTLYQIFPGGGSRIFNKGGLVHGNRACLGGLISWREKREEGVFSPTQSTEGSKKGSW